MTESSRKSLQSTENLRRIVQNTDAIRNIAVIAHVDHGKTTLSDTLIHRAGICSRSKDRVLDTTKEEQERGITIKSCAITLLYELDGRVAVRTAERQQQPPVSRQHSPPLDENSNEDELVEVYIGNIPFGVTREELLTALPRETASLELNSRRGFAFALIPPKALPAHPITMNERTLVVEKRGVAPHLMLQNHMLQRGWRLPVYEDVDVSVAPGVHAHVARLRLPSLGTVFESPAPCPSRKEARRQAAVQCLVSLGLAPQLPPNNEVVGKEEANPAVAAEAVARPERTELMVNLIDSPGHVDFSSEVTAALRLTDGALVVVDAVESVCVQTETVLRQALVERVKPVLLLNKVDRLLLEMQLSCEEMLAAFLRTVDQVNAIIRTYQDPSLPDMQVSILDGSVAFGSGKQGWAFTLQTFEDLYARKGVSREKFRSRFRVNSFNNSFCKMVLEPIHTLFEASMAGDDERANRLVTSLAIPLSTADAALTGKAKLNAIMQAFLPAADGLLEMVSVHLPSPLVAQAYRGQTLYDGPSDDECATSIRECDPSGPLMLYVSKLVPFGNRVYAFGRVFGGTLRAGMNVRVLGPSFTLGKESDCSTARVQGLVVMMGSKVESVDEMPAGAVVGLAGLDRHIIKTATITSSPTACCMRMMRFSVSPVVQIAVRPKDAKRPDALRKLSSALKLLSQTDPCLVVTINHETGEMLMAGSGELHVQVSLNALTEMGLEVEASPPVITYRETVCGRSPVACLAKSTNKHNRVYIVAEPLDRAVIDDMERLLALDTNARVRALVDEHGWNVNDARKIWAFDNSKTNVFVDCTSGVQIAHDVKDSLQHAFQLVCDEGVLAREPLSGVRFNLVDLTHHSDSVHRGLGQILPAAQRAMFAAMLTAGMQLVEAVFAVEIQAAESVVGAIYSVLTRRRGQIVSDEAKEGTPLRVLSGYLPVKESFGFDAELRGATGGRAFPQCSFSHWQPVPADALQVDSFAGSIVAEIRERKRLPPAVPQPSALIDRL